VDPDGLQLGIRPLPEALTLARQLDLDLVEVAPQANPPVCRIMDYGKFKFDAAQKAKESRRKTTSVGIKEMKYRPKIGIGDFDTKTRQVIKFLDEGHKVKVTIMFRGREVFHPGAGQEDPRPSGRTGGRHGPGGGGAEVGRSQHGDGPGPDKRAKQSAAARAPRTKGT
jgi:translation initiation factor IF-3